MGTSSRTRIVLPLEALGRILHLAQPSFFTSSVLDLQASSLLGASSVSTAPLVVVLSVPVSPLARRALLIVRDIVYPSCCRCSSLYHNLEPVSLVQGHQLFH